MTPKALADLRTLAEAATPGPWHIEENGQWEEGEDGWTDTYKVVGPNYLEVPEEGYYVRKPDAAYIAALSPDVVLALLERAERAEAAVPDDPLQSSNDGWNWWCYSCGAGEADDCRVKPTHDSDCGWLLWQPFAAPTQPEGSATPPQEEEAE